MNGTGEKAYQTISKDGLFTHDELRRIYSRAIRCSLLDGISGSLRIAYEELCYAVSGIDEIQNGVE